MLKNKEPVEVYIIPPEENFICKDCIYCLEDELPHLAGDCCNGHCEFFHKAIDSTEDICQEFIERNNDY